MATTTSSVLISALDITKIHYRMLGENGSLAERSMGGPTQVLELLVEDFSKNLVRGREIRVKEIFESSGSEKAFLVTLLAYTRCIKNGVGERLIFYKALLQLYQFAPVTVCSLVPLLSREDCFGSWKDYERIAIAASSTEGDFSYLINTMATHHANVLCTDFSSLTQNPKCTVSLAAKYAPSENCAGWDSYGKILAVEVFKQQHSHVAPDSRFQAYKEYRKMVSSLREASNIIERKLCLGDLESIDFSKIPSGAMRILGKHAFRNIKKDKTERHDDLKWASLAKRFTEFLNRSKAGEVKVHGGRLQIHQLPTMLEEHDEAVEAQVRNLIETLQSEILERGVTEASISGVVSTNNVVIDMGKTIVMSDVSRSMEQNIARNVQAIDISTVLGWLISQLAAPAWKDRVMTFHESPTWVDTSKMTSHHEKYKAVRNASWGYNTNFEKAFMLVLDVATAANLTREDMSGLTLLVLSDMQFDQAACSQSVWETMYETLKHKFQQRNYPLPRVVFWNLAARDTDGFVVSHNTKGVITMSGFGVGQIKDLIGGANLDVGPLEHMIKIFNSPHFQPVREVVAASGEFPVPEGFVDGNYHL